MDLLAELDRVEPLADRPPISPAAANAAPPGASASASGHAQKAGGPDESLVSQGASATVEDPYELPTELKVQRALKAIDEVFEAGHPVVVAYSAGKDSSVMLYLVLEAALRRKRAGQPMGQILVTHASTEVDNPAYENVARLEIERIRRFAADHELPLRLDIATPSLNDSWAVRIISGRALPTFANSATRDCSVSLKVVPQQRQRKAALKELAVEGEPVVMVGTRFDESATRQHRMQQRGEKDSEIWREAVRAPDGRVVREELRLSPICYFTQEDVWVILADLQTGERKSYTDAKDIWEAYRDGGGTSCAVVSDDVMKAAAKACGARFGCWSCAAVGRDKSLEAMIDSDPKYEFMRGLNRLQRFIVDTQYDMERRSWVGRTIDKDGFIAIAPDSYSPAMQRDLLRYALTLDKKERRSAAQLGIAPRFQIVSLRQLVAIDIIWSMQGYHPRPFEAMHIYLDVNEGGRNYSPPAVDPSVFDKKLPKPQWLYVGKDYDSDPGHSDVYTGARHLMADFSGATEHGGCAANVELGNGRVVMEVEKSDFFEVDEEGAELFLVFDVLDNRIHEKTAGLDAGEAFRHYQMLGTFTTHRRHLGEQDYMLRRADWKRRHGVFEMTREQLLERSVTSEQRSAGLLCPPGGTTLGEDFEADLQAQHRRRTASRASP